MRQLVKHTLILSASNVITRFMGMVFFVILARALTVSEYGLFRYLLTLSTIYALVFTGVPTALTKFLGDRAVDPHSKKEYLDNSLFLMLVLYAASAVIIMVFSRNPLLLLLFTFALLVDQTYVGFTRGILNYLKLNGFKLVENSIKILILVIAYIILRRVDITFSVAFYSLSSLASALIFEAIKPEFQISLNFSWSRIKELLRYAVPVTLGSIGWTLLFGISSVYIERFHGTEQLGYFSVGLTVMQVFSFFPDATYTILLPKVAGLKDKSTLIRPLRLAALGCLLISILISLPLLLFKNFILNFIFSEKYLPAAVVLAPLTISQIFLVVQQVYTTAWQGLGKPGISSIIISIAAGINIILGYSLTKSHGIVGAAFSLAIASFVSLLIVTLIWKRWVNKGGLEAANVNEQEA